MQFARRAFSFAFASAGSSRDAKIAMIAMTTSSSMSVKVSESWVDYNLNRQNSVSYAINVDGGYLNGAMAFDASQGHVMFGDRNLRFDPGAGSCSAGFISAQTIAIRGATSVQWTNAVHGFGKGNLGFFDGHAEMSNHSDMTNALARSDDRGDLHWLKAR